MDTVIASTGAAVQVNENFYATTPAALFGRKASTCSGLVFGYYGGRYNSALIADATVALTASTTNYIVALRTTGVVSAGTLTQWNAGTHARLYLAITDTLTVTSYEDHRQAIAAPVAMPGYTVATLPAATVAGVMVLVTNESGGAVPAFSDGTNWLRVTDRAVVS